MLCAIALGASLATSSPSPSPAPPVAASDVTANDTLITPIKTLSFQTAYTASSYGPGNLRATQIIPRLASFFLGKSLLRISLPRIQTVNGVDSSYGDMQVFYLFQRGLKQRGKYAGIFLQMPTGTGPLTSNKWIAGPAFAYALSYKPKIRTIALLVQTGFSFAGPKSAANQSVITVLPVATLSIGKGWFLKWPEAPWTFDLQRGATVIPVGVGVGRTGTFDGVPYALAISDDTALIHAHAPQAPKNTIRVYLTFVIAQ